MLLLKSIRRHQDRSMVHLAVPTSVHFHYAQGRSADLSPGWPYYTLGYNTSTEVEATFPEPLSGRRN
ncbi:hypothetical protein E4T48_08588 [Aureobasidium sp. EXF-10727]|nr:hypothetical protein E4T48_08588 [Aureobasidium sp. EXF-10727]KAI4723710.1 hypothetical protein E4T49_08565 [Aureobasidium sp. EXF-10728]